MGLVLFDLDGTLIDSALDLGWALNTLLNRAGKDSLPLDTIRPWVSGGAGMLIRNGFQITAEHPEHESLKRQLVTLYAEDPLRHTVAFDGVHELLNAIEARGLQWGIVTNKMGWLTAPIVQGLDWHQRSVCTVSGDTLPTQKPDPEPLLHACALAGSTPAQTVYVGDARTDIIAGQRAGMATCVALYGYLAADETPQDWGATHLLDTPSALLDWLEATGF